MKRQAHTLILSLAALILLAATLRGQTGNGSIQGTVKDQSGAVVPTAKVIATHVTTARAYESAANEAGRYLFPSLQPGEYSVGVSAPGMTTWSGKLLLQTGQPAVVDVELKVGATATVTVVTAEVESLLTTTAPTLGSVVERQRVDQLPLNGRLFQSLIAQTTPGVEGGTESPRVFGLRDGAMEFVQDGAVLSNRNIGQITSRPPGLDTINEFRVESNASAAKFNRPATTILSTRSGTNQLHGSAFETARNNGIGVARRREDFYEKPPLLVRNEFGASLGGPIHVPKVYSGRNKSFFFFAWEEFRLRSAGTTSTSMPSAAMRQGDFSKLVDGTGRQITLYDPWTTAGPQWSRLPFVNNVIPISKRSPVAERINRITPEATLPDINPMLGANYYGLSPSNRADRTFTWRFDHRLGDRDQIFGRYSRGHRITEVRRSSGTAGSPISLDQTGNYEFQPNYDNNASVSWTHVFSPSFFMETIASGSHEDWNYNLTSPGGDRNIAKEMGLPNPFNVNGLPDFTDMGFGLVYNGTRPRRDLTRLITGEQNFTKVRGKHQVEFGWRYRNEALDVLPDQPIGQGWHQFASNGTALYDPATGASLGATPRTGHNAANFFLGLANNYMARFNRGWYHLRTTEYAGYVQDTWKVAPSLTLNAGVRYEYFPPIREQDNILFGFDPKSKSMVSGLPIDEVIRRGYTTSAIVKGFDQIGVRFISTKEAGLPSDFINPERKDFNPRAGFAWTNRLHGRQFVVRGGYGVFRFALPMRIFNAHMRENPPTQLDISNTPTLASQSPDGRANWPLRSVPTLIAGVNTQDVLNLDVATVRRGSFRPTYFNPDQPTSTAHEWNFTVETEVMKNTVARAGYIGTAGRNLDIYNIYNRQPSNYVWFMNTGEALPTGTYAEVAKRAFDKTTYGDIAEFGKYAYSNYSGIQLELQRRYSKGLAYQFFYVMSNAMTTGTIVSGGGTITDNAIFDPGIYLNGSVPADLQERNRFLNYRRDTSIPKHRLRWNFIVDLPFGSGKQLLGGAKGWLNRVAGGWQVAGSGTYVSRYFALPTTNWGELRDVEVYGLQNPIQDCRSGQCIDGYLFYNGYIPANRINSTDANGKPNGVMGVPSGYKPAHQPIYPTPANGGSSADPNYALYETNTTNIRLKDGTTQRVTVDTGLHPWRNQFVAGPWAFMMNSSLFKSIPLVEGVALRFSADFFNTFNNPQLVLPDSTSGIISKRLSNAGPRELQLSLRLTW